VRVLVACEFSGMVRNAFQRAGHTAYSCDLDPCECAIADDWGFGNCNCRGEYHYQEDIWELLKRIPNWDLLIAHPPCTFLCTSANPWLDQPGRMEKRELAIDFFMRFTKTKVPRVCIENPIGIMSTEWRKPNQIVHPWMFGDGYLKRTCFWYINLPRLPWGPVSDGREQECLLMSPSEDRGKMRSITYPGIANAMARRWGVF